ADLHKLLAAVMPATATVADVVREVFGLASDNRRIARDLDREAVAELHAQIKRGTATVEIDIGRIGPDASLLPMGRHPIRPISREPKSPTAPNAGPRAHPWKRGVLARLMLTC
ncbi:MAG: hypothetical protein ACREE1_09950, partial [Stellaceae bacterium]